MAGFSESVVITPRLDEALAPGTNSQASGLTAPEEDFRVRCTSKQAVLEILGLCGRFVQNLGDALPEEIREAALRDVQWVSRLFICHLPYPPARDPGLGRVSSIPGC